MRKNIPYPFYAFPIDVGVLFQQSSICFSIDFFEAFTHGDKHHADRIEFVYSIWRVQEIIRRMDVCESAFHSVQGFFNLFEFFEKQGWIRHSGPLDLFVF